jgi:hypothetical protein
MVDASSHAIAQTHETERDRQKEQCQPQIRSVHESLLGDSLHEAAVRGIDGLQPFEEEGTRRRLKKS